MEGDLLPQAPVVRGQHHTVPSALASLADTTPQTILQREAARARRGPAHIPLSDQDIFNNGAGSQYGSLTIAHARQEDGRDHLKAARRRSRALRPSLRPTERRSGVADKGQRIGDSIVDRGLYGVQRNGGVRHTIPPTA